MKIKVVANELVDSDIEMVSLVRHGANRCAFKLLKTDDTQTLSDKLGDFLHLNSDDPKITAFYIKKAATEAVLPILKTAGFAGETETFEGVNILKVSDGATKAVFQLTNSVAVGIDQPVKLIADEGIVKAHAVVVGTDGFYPGIGLATTTLDSVVWNLLNSNGDQASPDRLEKTESMLASFRKYVGTLLRVLPKEVVQVEGALRSHEISKEAGTDMTKVAKLEEAVTGDLDILKTEAVAATTEVVTAEETKVEAAADKKEEAVVVKEEDRKEETKVETPVDPILAALAKIEGRFDTLQAAITKTQEDTAALATKLDKVEELAKTASDKAKKPVVVVNKSEDSDFALEAMGGSRRQEAKARFAKDGVIRDSVWDGMFDELSEFRPSR